MRHLERPNLLPWPIHIGFAALALIAMAVTLNWYDIAYQASGMPVSFAIEQTRFNAAETKAYYAHLNNLGTLSLFRQAQIVDFAYILAAYFAGLCVATFVARFGRPASWAKRLGLLAALLIISGAIVDVAENLISFVLLANPAEFADWIAIAYSTVASCKFLLGSSGWLALFVAILALVCGRSLNQPKLG
ncbi:MAG: hypothetical protein AAF412_06775 [Pseudomonadota bacterium]